MSSDIQNALDQLDIRIALGEIDLGTYQMLKAKFNAQMAQGSAPVQAMVASMPRQTYILKCQCGAALNVVDPAALSALCEYCGGVNLLRPAEDAAERLQANIRRWIAEQAGGIGTGGTIDEASRKFIFTDKLLPSLRLEANRANEAFSTVRHAALFSFPLANEVTESPFLSALRDMPDFSYSREKLQLTEARVEAPELLMFAVSDTDKGLLAMIGAQCRESMRMAKVRECLMRFDDDGFSQTLANLRGLREIYDHVVSLSANDAARETFARGLSRRVNAVADATAQLALLHREADGVMTDPIISGLERIAGDCEVAALDIERSGVEARERVPATEGTRADAQTIRVLRDSVSLFGMCGAENGHSYQQFSSSLSGLASRAREPSANLDWVGGFMSHLALHVAALNGEPLVAAVTDFSALEHQATMAARSSMFTGTESATVAGRMLVPFWMAQLQFSQQTGVIFKTGHAAQELLFVEACAHSGRWLRATTESPLGAGAMTALASPTSVSCTNNPLVPVVSSDRAAVALKRIIQTTPGFAGGQPKLLGLVYLPALKAVYSSKKSQRSQFFVGNGQEFGDLSPTSIPLGTIQIHIC